MTGGSAGWSSCRCGRDPAASSEAGLAEEREKRNGDDTTAGTLFQRRRPRHIVPNRIITAMDPAKDVDGFRPLNVGRLWNAFAGLVPCTPQGCLILLRTVHPD